jgi:hypothetical protein
MTVGIAVFVAIVVATLWACLSDAPMSALAKVADALDHIVTVVARRLRRRPAPTGSTGTTEDGTPADPDRS